MFWMLSVLRGTTRKPTMNNFPTCESRPSANSRCYESEIRFFQTAHATFELCGKM